MKYLVALTLLSSPAFAQSAEVNLHHARVRVSDIAPKVAKEIADIDLGPAPFAGSSRDLRRDDVVARVEHAGLHIDRQAIPERSTVRLQTRQLSTEDQRHFADAEILKELPPGAQLISVTAGHAATIPTDAVLGHVSVPTLAKRRGRQVVTALAEIVLDDVTVARLPLFCAIELSEEAVRPDVRRGDEVRATAGGGGISVSTPAVAMADARVGDVAQVQIVATGRVVRARVASHSEVRVVDSP